MRPERKATIKTYEDSAQQLADYFEGIGARIDDIEKAIELCPNPDSPKVLELGCGDGRDAVEISKRSGWYLGIDTSRSLLGIASQRLGPEYFEQADISDFTFPPDLDVIYGFAYLLHLDKSEVEATLCNAFDALNPGGIFYISLKYAEEYSSEVKKDKFGERQFYYYNPDEIAGLNDEYDEVYCDYQKIGSTKWFTLALRKPSN